MLLQPEEQYEGTGGGPGDCGCWVTSATLWLLQVRNSPGHGYILKVLNNLQALCKQFHRGTIFCPPHHKDESLHLPTPIAIIVRRTRKPHVYIPSCHEQKPLVHEQMHDFFRVLIEKENSSSRNCSQRGLWIILRRCCRVFQTYFLGPWTSTSEVSSGPMIVVRRQTSLKKSQCVQNWATCASKILSSLSAGIFLFITVIYYWRRSSCDAENSIRPRSRRWPIPRIHPVTRSYPKKGLATASSKQGCFLIEQVWLAFLPFSLHSFSLSASVSSEGRGGEGLAHLRISCFRPKDKKAAKS